MEMKHYLSILLKWAWLILLATGLAASLSYWNTAQQPALYQATTTLRVGQFLQSANPQAGDFMTSQQLARLYAQSVKGQPIVEAAAEALGIGGSWQGIASSVSAAPVEGTELMRISVVDTDPQRAKLIADEVARQLILQSPTVQEREIEEQRQFVGDQLVGLKTRIEDAEAKIQDLEAQVDAASSARVIRETQDRIGALEGQIRYWQDTYANLLDFYRGSRTNFLSVVDAASVPGAPLGSGMLFNLMVAIAIGFVLAAGAALLIEYIDDTVRTEEDVERTLDLPTVGFIARMGKGERARETPSSLDVRSPMAELYRVVTTNLQFLRFEDSSPAILVTSPSAGEGKSITAANLAASFALSGKRTILVDADLRRPSVHTHFGASAESGLTSLFLRESQELSGQALDGRGEVATSTRSMWPALGKQVEDFLVDTRVPNLRILPSGPLPPSPAELLGSDRMQKVLRVLSSIADVVIVDSAPLLPVADTAVLASKGMQVVLVAEAGKTRTHSARLAKRMLARARARVLGVVINRVPKSSLPYYGHSYYGGASASQGPIQRLAERLRGGRMTTAHVSPSLIRHVAPENDESSGV